MLKINQLKELINKTIIDHGYADLQFGQPEMDKFVIVNFTATDNNDERKEFDSTNTLRKLISSVLETTNWRLMSEGIHCRLGIVSGRLKAYEREDDLVGLVRQKLIRSCPSFCKGFRISPQKIKQNPKMY